MRTRNAIVFDLAVLAIVVAIVVTCHGASFDAQGTWVVDTAATRVTRKDPLSPAASGTLTLDVRGCFCLDILDGSAHLAPRSGVWAARSDGFSIHEGGWRDPLGRDYTARARADGAVLLDLSGRVIVLRRPQR